MLYEQSHIIYQAQGEAVEAARVARAMVDALMLLGKYERALHLAEEARQVFLAHNEHVHAAQLEVNVGNIYHRQDRNHEALDCFQRAGKILHEAGDRVAQATVAINSANIYVNLDDFRQAKELYEKAYEGYLGEGKTALAAEAKHNLGYLHFLTGNYHYATRILYEVQSEFTTIGSHRLAALCDLDLAEIFLQLHVLDEAKTKAAQARARLLSLEMHYEAAKALTWEGLSCLHAQQLDEAEKLLENARAEFTTEGNSVWRELLTLYLAELFLKRNQASKALPLAVQAHKFFAAEKLVTKACYAQLIQAKAFQQLGDLKWPICKLTKSCKKCD